MSAVPLEFDPYAWEDNLELVTTAGITEARWPLLGLSVFYPDSSDVGDDIDGIPPFREDVGAHTPQLRFFGQFGFTLGRYSEFFVERTDRGLLVHDDDPKPFHFTMGSVSGSFGQPTPLAHLLFQNDHDDDVDGEFNSLFTLRFVGAASEHAESVVLSAMLLLERENRFALRPVEIGGPLDWRVQDEEKTTHPQREQQRLELVAPVDRTARFDGMEAVRALRGIFECRLRQ